MSLVFKGFFDDKNVNDWYSVSSIFYPWYFFFSAET